MHSPALAYANAISAMRLILAALFTVPSSFKIPQCPCVVYGHKQISQATVKLGNRLRMSDTALTMGFSGLSALVPTSS